MRGPWKMTLYVCENDHAFIEERHGCFRCPGTCSPVEYVLAEPQTCPDCHGSGVERWDAGLPERCSTCKHWPRKAELDCDEWERECERLEAEAEREASNARRWMANAEDLQVRVERLEAALLQLFKFGERLMASEVMEERGIGRCICEGARIVMDPVAREALAPDQEEEKR